MFDYRPYMITIVAIFLALASGIVIGITFGENVVVSNQKETIEIMQQQLKDLEYRLVIKQEEVERWQGLEPMVIKGYQGCLSPKKILVLTLNKPGPLVGDIIGLLQESGAETCLAELPAAPAAGEELDPQTAREFAAELGGPEGIGICQVCDLEGELSGIPDWVVILLNAGDPQPGDRFLKLLGEELISAGYKLIVAYPGGRDGENYFLGEQAIVEHLDSFWGQLALLELVSGNIHNIFSGGVSEWK